MDQYFHGNVVSPHIRHRTELHKKWTQLWSACWKCTSQYHVGQSVKSVLLSLIIFAPYMFDVDPLTLPCSNIQWCLSLSLSLSGLAPCRLTEMPSTADYGVSCCLQPVFRTIFMSPMLSLQQHQHVNWLGGKERQHCPTPSPSQLCSRKSDVAQSSISRLRF